MLIRHWQTRLATILAVTVLAAAVSGCGGKSVQTTAPVATPNPTQQARILTDTAEAKYLSLISVDLGEQIRAQPWFKQLTQAHVDLIAAMMRTERAAKAKGEEASVRDMLTYAAEQPWYSDGLEDPEARGLRGAFMAYEESLSNRNAPTIGPVLSQALQHGTFRPVDLPVGGEMLIVVSAEDPAQAQAVLDLSLEALPQIEALVGAYPYDFLHMMVTDLGEYLAGLSYDQFIIVAPNSIDMGTVVHELTHSTMYGKFPIWFEEGFAHFVQYHLTGTLDQGAAEATAALRQLRTDGRLYVGEYRDSSFAGYLAERAQGFLFMKAVYELKGLEGLTQLLGKLRTKSLGDQELLREFVQFGSLEEQRAMQAHFCAAVVGTARNYCR
ncbi:MAG TPA: hypothetical protein VG845_03960 [Dehalococcoidia bacterium]|nr:hypothetical protein [Dehalococcoidia bacterium]